MRREVRSSLLLPRSHELLKKKEYTNEVFSSRSSRRNSSTLSVPKHSRSPTSKRRISTGCTHSHSKENISDTNISKSRARSPSDKLFLRHSECSVGDSMEFINSDESYLLNENKSNKSMNSIGVNSKINHSIHIYPDISMRSSIVSWLYRLGIGSTKNELIFTQQFNINEVKIIKPVVVLDNEWDNGILFCELIPILTPLDKNSIKHVEKCDKFRRRMCPRILLSGCELHVKSKAQALRNYQILLQSFEMLPDIGLQGITLTAEEVLTSDAIKWKIIYKMYNLFGPNSLYQKELRRLRNTSKTGRRGRSLDRQSSNRVRFSSEGAAATSRSPSRNSVRVRAQSPKRSKSADSNTSKDLVKKNAECNREHMNNIFRGRSNKCIKKVKKEDWIPPDNDKYEVESATKLILPIITVPEQSQLRGWLLSLGISVLDGEGGYYSEEPSLHLIQSQIAPPLSLCDDKLRNGETLCDLLCILEPTAAAHVHLQRIIHRHPRSIQCALMNIKRALWLFKLRKSPPLPYNYLCQPSKILQGDKNILWGLLREIMFLYAPNAPKLFNTENADDNVVNGVGSLSPPRQFKVNDKLNSIEERIPSQVNWWFKLPYSSTQRRLLDKSLLQWLQSSHNPNPILRLSTSSVSITPPSTMLELEGPIRDGTLLCLLIESWLNLPIKPWNKHPLTYSQCVANIGKAVSSLQICLNMSGRYLHQGIEDEVVRGNWDCILGLFEDIRKFHDNVPPRPAIPTKVDWDLEGKVGPYLGDPSYTTSKTTTESAGNKRHVTPTRKPMFFAELNHLEMVKSANTPIASVSNTFTPIGGENDMEVDSLTKNIQQRSPLKVPVVSGTDIIPIGSAQLQRSVNHSNINTSDIDAEVFLLNESVDRSHDSGGISNNLNKSTSSAVSVESINRAMGVTRRTNNLEIIMEWLVELGLVRPNQDEETLGLATLSRDPEYIRNFSDGILLCALVRRLEKMTNPIAGVILEPRSSAQRLQNIRKGLETIASLNKRIPLSALACEEEILSGNKDSITSLLLAIKKGYSKFRISSRY